jgi:hypothetical protein
MVEKTVERLRKPEGGSERMGVLSRRKFFLHME